MSKRVGKTARRKQAAMDRLLSDKGIVRNGAKIQAVIENATPTAISSR